MKKIVIGNWKMNFNLSQTKIFIEKFNPLVKQCKGIEFGICPNFISLKYVVDNNSHNYIVAAQNCNDNENGAFTGEISITMLQDIQIKYCLIGHSERRKYYNETDESVNRKNIRLLERNVIPILCIGENLDEYQNHLTKAKLSKQIKLALKNVIKKDVIRIVFAYEPIWAIGTGKTATPEIANSICEYIKNEIYKIYEDNNLELKVIYGGSVNLENVESLVKSSAIDGVLVGGQSLDPVIFANIIKLVEKIK